MPPNTVKVDRSTRWGNVFVAVRRGGFWRVERGDAVVASGLTREEAIYIAVVRHACEVAPLLDLEPLRGKNLGCWCGPGELCHGDTLLELANS